MAHTKGPWKAIKNSSWGETHKVAFGDKAGYVICTGKNLIAHASVFPSNTCTKEEADSNAHLIAAAPEMLGALENLLDRVGDYIGEYVEHIEQLIAKAKGETNESNP